MSKKDNSSDNPEILDQDLLLSFIKVEELNGKTKEADHSGTYILPSVKTRYFSLLIDMTVILILALVISQLFELFKNVPDSVRGTLFVIVFILYEPILETSGYTVGQFMVNIRVRNFHDPKKKLNFLSALIRFVVKVVLGWLSFITLSFNRNRRAIHDFAGSSIVITKKEQNLKTIEQGK